MCLSVNEGALGQIGVSRLPYIPTTPAATTDCFAAVGIAFKLGLSLKWIGTPRQESYHRTALSLLRRDPCVNEFAGLSVHVLYVSHPSALEGSTIWASELVDRFIERYAQTRESH